MTRWILTYGLGVVLTGLVLGAPASAQDAGSAAEAAQESAPNTNQCIFFRSLYDWKPLSNTSLILWGTRTQPYHLTLTPPCNGLRFANVIGFSSRTSRVCVMDAVLVDNGPGFPERCLIQAVVKLDDESLQTLMAQTPGADPRKKTAPETPQ